MSSDLCILTETCSFSLKALRKVSSAATASRPRLISPHRVSPDDCANSPLASSAPHRFHPGVPVPISSSQYSGCSSSLSYTNYLFLRRVAYSSRTVHCVLLVFITIGIPLIRFLMYGQGVLWYFQTICISRIFFLYPSLQRLIFDS